MTLVKRGVSEKDTILASADGRFGVTRLHETEVRDVLADLVEFEIVSAKKALAECHPDAKVVSKVRSFLPNVDNLGHWYVTVDIDAYDPSKPDNVSYLELKQYKIAGTISNVLVDEDCIRDCIAKRLKKTNSKVERVVDIRPVQVYGKPIQGEGFSSGSGFFGVTCELD